jgi:hypothetical protein
MKDSRHKPVLGIPHRDAVNTIGGKLTDGQAAVTDRPCVPPLHKPMLEMERILMVDFTSTQAQAKELAPLVI